MRTYERDPNLDMCCYCDTDCGSTCEVTEINEAAMRELWQEEHNERKDVRMNDALNENPPLLRDAGDRRHNHKPFTFVLCGTCGSDNIRIEVVSSAAEEPLSEVEPLAAILDFGEAEDDLGRKFYGGLATTLLDEEQGGSTTHSLANAVIGFRCEAGHHTYLIIETHENSDRDGPALQILHTFLTWQIPTSLDENDEETFCE